MKKLMIPAGFAVILALGACGGNQGSDNNSDSATTSESSTTNSTTATDTASNTNAGATTAAGANGASSDTSMSGDNGFISEAASGGLMEVELGKTASINAASAKVKEFGRMMVKDHTKANAELKAVAAKKSVTVPATPLEKHQMHITELKAKKGAEFDQAYVDMMVNDHQEDVSKFEDESKNGKDPAVKAFATKTLPVLQKHLASIKAIQDGMKK
ncbi:MAG: DUF4142 domain-containing protein [Segetibacter sp.]